MKPVTLAIKRIDAIPVALPLIKPMTLARTRITQALSMLVRIEARNGAVGWGEAACMPTATGENLRTIQSALSSSIVPYLLGKDAGSQAQLIARLARRAALSRAALSAADMALADLTGHAHNLPVSELLGGRLHETLVPMWLLGGATVEADVAEARRQMRAGYRFFKIKVGAKPLAGSIDTINALRHALGAQVKLCADANMGLTPREASRFVRGIAGAGLLYFEQPFAKDQVQAMTRLARASKVPVGVDESVVSVPDIVAHYRAAAAQGVAIKSIALGSLAAAVGAAAVANALGMAVNISAKIAESSIGAAALLHVASVIDDASWGVSPTNCYLAADVARTPIAPARGRIAVPQGPGLGVEIDAAAVKRFRIR
jgi:muconate cycloisomerase